MSIFSNDAQFESIQKILCGYLRLPFSTDRVRGAFMEAVLAHVRGGEVLATYDYVDVVEIRARVGWSIKSTKSATPLTWKRAKIGNKAELIAASMSGASGLQALGDELIRFCNTHAHASLNKYDLKAIGYARLILFPDGTIRYLERELCSRAKPDIFDPGEFSWSLVGGKGGWQKGAAFCAPRASRPFRKALVGMVWAWRKPIALHR